MNFYKNLKEIKEIYQKGGNIINYLKEISGNRVNTSDIINMSYDLQAGSYIKFTNENQKLWNEFTKGIAAIIDQLKPNTLMEAGMGDGTNIGCVIPQLNYQIQHFYGFDISWSRVYYASKYVNDKNKSAPHTFFVGDLFHIPLKDNSVEVVYTCHAIEPNGRREMDALQELYRVAANYLVLIEPANEFADDKARKAMLEKGYITDLYKSIKTLGYELIEHRLFDHYTNPENKPGLYIIRKKTKKDIPIGNPFACPVTGEEIEFIEGAYYGRNGMLAYPIIKGIPCLLPGKAIIATHYLEN